MAGSRVSLALFRVRQSGASEARYTVSHALAAGLLAAVFYLMALYLGGKQAASTAEPLAWLIAIFIPVAMYMKGADYGKIRFSFSWSFLAVLAYVYVPTILLLGLGGVPRALAILMASLITAHVVFNGHLILVARRGAKKAGVRVPLSLRIRMALFRLDRLLISFIIIGFFVLIFFLLTPILIMLKYAFTPPVYAGKSAPIYENFVTIFRGSDYVRLFHFPDEVPWRFIKTETGQKILVVSGVNYGALLNSLINSTIVTAVATLLGIIVAFVLARYKFPGKSLIRVLAVVPLFVTPFVNSYAVKLIFGPTGPISWITSHLFGFVVDIRYLAGVTIAQIMAFYPIVYLNAYAGFLGVDPSMEEQAENLGARGFRLFRSVTLPLALPGIAAGAVIVFIFSLEDLGAPIVFQAHELMSYKIFSGFTTETGTILPEYAALGFVMLFFALSAFYAIRSYVGLRSYAMVQKGGRWKPRERKLGPVGLALVYLVLLPLIIFTMLPQITVVLMAFNIVPPTSFKIQLDHATTEYIVALFKMPDLFKYVRNTLTYAFAAVVFAVTLSVILAYTISRVKLRFIGPTLDGLSMIPLAIPGLVVALGYYYFFSTVFKNTPVDPAQPPTIFQAWVILVIAYTIRKLPFVMRSVYAGVQQVHENLEEAALNLGANRRKTVFGIVLPLILTYLVSGAVIGFVYVSTEVSTSITIGGLNPDQAPMTFYMMEAFTGSTPKGVNYVAAMGLLLILIQMIAILIIIVGLKQSYAFIGA